MCLASGRPGQYQHAGHARPSCHRPADRSWRCRRSSMRWPAHPSAVLEAPPGAGKTTLGAAPSSGRALARRPADPDAGAASARRPAAAATDGRATRRGGRAVPSAIAIRFERRTGRRPRIEVVTEGLLTRYLQRDPALEAYGCVIFDEFHERSLDADLGLALCLEVQESLRPDLSCWSCRPRWTAPRWPASWASAPLVRSEGRLFPVRVEHLGGDRGRADRAARARERWNSPWRPAPAACSCSCPARARSGARRRCSRAGCRRARRSTRSMASCRAPSRTQRSGRRGQRKIVLATNIAETSLTIEGVVGGGRQRAGAARPVLAAHGHEPAGHRADQPRLGRAAQGPRRPARAGPVLPPVVDARRIAAGRRSARPRSRRPIWRRWRWSWRPGGCGRRLLPCRPSRPRGRSPRRGRSVRVWGPRRAGASQRTAAPWPSCRCTRARPHGAARRTT